SRLASYVAALHRCELMIGLYAARNTVDLARAAADVRGSTFAKTLLPLGARLSARKIRGRTPVNRSKATLKTSALRNPREHATLSMLLRGTNNRCCASAMRASATNRAGVLPNTSWNKRVKLRRDMAALWASAS